MATKHLKEENKFKLSFYLTIIIILSLNANTLKTCELLLSI